MEKTRRVIRLTMFALLGFSVLLQITTTWDNTIAIIGETIVILYGITYFTILSFAKEGIFFLRSKTGEQAGIVEINGLPEKLLVFSDKYHADGWDIARGKRVIWEWPQLFVENVRYLGAPWQTQMKGLSMTLKEFDKPSDAGLTRPHVRDKSCESEGGLINLFHSHAYISEEIEIKGNFHVKEYFYLRFRFSNIYKAFLETDVFVHNMESIVLECAKELSAVMTFDKLRAASTSKADDFSERLEEIANQRLLEYGIEVLDIQFINLEQTRAEEEEAQKAVSLAKIQAEALVIKKTAEAEGDRLVKKVDVDLDVARARRLRIAVEGDANLLTAYALTKNTGLKVIGNGALPLINLDDEEKDRHKTEEK